MSCSVISNIKYPDLPVANRREEIMTAMREHQVVVGETGSGKTTQLPKTACEEGRTGRVGCTQSRRLATGGGDGGTSGGGGNGF